MRQLLKNLLDECKQCNDHFLDNVGMIVDDGQMLSDDQVEAVIIELNEKHWSHETCEVQ